MYLGMHTPLDVVCGVITALLLLMFWFEVEDFVDAFVTTGSYGIPLRLHPGHTAE